MTRWPADIIESARKMRSAGATYGEIGKQLGVAKSTLNTWLKDLPNLSHEYFTDRNSWMEKIRKLSNKAIKRKRSEQIKRIEENVRQEVATWSFLTSRETQKALLGVLYWAEGQKLPLRGAPVKFTNTDPKLALLFLTMLRRCFQIDESRLRVRLYLHWYHKIKKVRRFWSDLLGVDESQFAKIYIKQRSKTKRFRKNFVGICFIVYPSVDLRWQIVHTGYNVAERIVGKIPTYTMKKLKNAPVA